MSNVVESARLSLPATTIEKLESYRHQVRVIKVIEGLLAAAFGLVASYLVVFVMDRFIDTPAVVRTVLLIAGAAGLGLYFPFKCHRWVWGTRRMEQVARLLSRKYPALGDQLLGVVELAQAEQQPGSSLRLARAAIEQVDESVRKRDFSDAVPKPKHWMWAKIVAAPVAIAIVALAVVPSASLNAAARWLMPWRSIDRYTFAQVEALPQRVVVPHGEEFEFSTRLAESTRWSPASATARFDQQPTVSTERTENAYPFRLPPQTTSGELHLRVGDLTKSVPVEVAERPELSGLSASVTLPTYLQYSKPMQADVRGGAISILKGATAGFVAEVSRDLANATINAAPATVSGNEVRSTPQVIGDSSVIEFQWTDELGLNARDAFRLKINAVDDGAPEVSIRQQETDGANVLSAVVLTTDVLTFELASRDDFGVQRVGLEWSGIEHPVQNPVPDKGEKLIQTGSAELRKLATTATFCADSDNLPAQSIELRAWTEDFKPDRGRQYSPPVVLHVMSPEQHAVWMMDQLRRWTSLADDVYEEEMRLLDENRRLRQLDPADLNAPETRRQIEQQAAAEKANGQRLEAVTDHGDELLKQALRNKEMMVGHLETWADGLQRLRAIAENRMPSVADMLSQSAKAPGQRSQSSNANTKTAPQAGNNRGTQPGQPGDPKKPAPEQPAVPALTDTESGFNKSNPTKPGESEPSKPGKPKFGLPSTTLQGGPPQEPKKPAQSPVEEKLDEAVEEQTSLLAEFEKVREDLQQIMDDLENSTFVKRLKAASREQLEVATALNRTLFDGFGVSDAEVKPFTREQVDRIASREEAQSQKVSAIQFDLQAYFDRRQEAKFQRILAEMKEYKVTAELTELGDRVRRNQSGDAIARAEFWADTLDRWAEEMVSASQCGQCKGCKGDSLPPSIVLEVMRILEGEMDLREETRGVEQVRKELARSDFRDKAEALSETQRKLHNRCVYVVEDILALPLGSQKFGKEIQIIGAAADAMDEAIDILGSPDTGAEAIAAETEAIELLLQSRRANPKGGGGSGGSNPGGGGTGTTDRVALELYGPGSDPNARIEERDVQQATGSTTEQVPAEFRDGLDAFFNAIDGGSRR